MFDSSKAGKIENEKVRTILNTLGLAINDLELEALLEEEDKEGKPYRQTLLKFRGQKW
jgi:Ca2+-binding EF-hand superfamily protein